VEKGIKEPSLEKDIVNNPQSKTCNPKSEF
jgi:hypothetical protein